MRRYALLLVGLLGLAVMLAVLAGCGTGSTSSVAIRGVNYHPDKVVVKAGTTVTWTNRDPEPNTVTSDNANIPATTVTASPKAAGAFNSGPIEPGNSWSLTFTTPGTYKYHCLIHGYMEGEVIVQ